MVVECAIAAALGPHLVPRSRSDAVDGERLASLGSLRLELASQREHHEALRGDLRTTTGAARGSGGHGEALRWVGLVGLVAYDGRGLRWV